MNHPQTATQPIQIGLVGDYNEAVIAHRAIPMALQMAGDQLGRAVRCQWLATDTLQDAAMLTGFDGLWCVPASPYRHADGALLAIRHARETGLPFLGTCGGFQHAILEYARNVLGWADAEHAETAPDAGRQVIAALSCGLVEVSDSVQLQPGSHLALAYQSTEAVEGYRCRYGINPVFADLLSAGPLWARAWDDGREIRAVELGGHPFFVATLFQPERAALQGRVPPLVQAYLAACIAGISRVQQ